MTVSVTVTGLGTDTVTDSVTDTVVVTVTGSVTDTVADSVMGNFTVLVVHLVDFRSRGHEFAAYYHSWHCQI